MRLWHRLAACLLLAGCSQPVPIGVGQVDPERIFAPPSEHDAQTCTLHNRGSVALDFVGLPLVTVRINGRPATLILDTGAEGSILTAAAARRLGVTNKYDFTRSMSGIGNSLQTGDARLDNMSIGDVKLAYPRVLVGGVGFTLGGVQTDGLLGASLLGDFDLDIDLPRRRLDLYDKLDCATLRPAWSGPYVSLETTRSLTLHPFFPVSINGRTLTATLDSGAQRTVIAASSAARGGINAESRIAGPEIHARGAAGETLPAELHQLRDFRIGGIAVHTPVLVTPVRLPRDIDALVGSDFLLQHRVWLSYGSRRLFIQ